MLSDRHSNKKLHVYTASDANWCVVAERSNLPDSSSGVSIACSSNPGRDTCVLEQDT